MRGLEARRVVAAVEHHHPDRDRPIRFLEGDAVNVIQLSLN